MRNLVSRSSTILIVLVLVMVGLNAQFKPAQRMPASASEYARLIEPELGVVPTIDCGEGVRVPIHVDGVEVFHPAHQPPQIDFYNQLADRHGLLKSGGSDSHGNVDGTRIGDYGVGYEVIEAMRERAATYV